MDPLDRTEVLSLSFLNRDLRSGIRVHEESRGSWRSDGWVPGTARCDEEALGVRGPGRCCRRVKVLSSRPLNASSNLLPSASTDSISCRMSLAVFNCSESVVMSSPLERPFGGSRPTTRPWKEEGGAAFGSRLALRVVVRERLGEEGVVGSVAIPPRADLT